jgi:dTDP-4-dehydrorhamnose reductase
MLRLGKERGAVSVVTDQVLSPTYTRDLARTLRELVQTQTQGVFHVTNGGACSWYEFARAIFELEGLRVEVRPTTSAAFGSKVNRPSYSVLDNHRLQEAGFSLPRPWREALATYLEARKDPPVGASVGHQGAGSGRAGV